MSADPELAKAARAKAARIRAIRKANPPIVAVTTHPAGPRCTVMMESGEIVHGYRVPDDYVGCQSIVVRRGWCVTADLVDQHGTLGTREHGRTRYETWGPDSKLIDVLRAEGRVFKLRVKPAIPPEFPALLRR